MFIFVERRSSDGTKNIKILTYALFMYSNVPGMNIHVKTCFYFKPKNFKSITDLIHLQKKHV